MSEDIRWMTKAGVLEEGTVRPDILNYFQDTTRQRGYPPCMLEIALKFGMNKPQAVREWTLIIQHLARITYESEKPKQDADVQLAPLTPPPGPGEIDLQAFTGRAPWPDERDRMIYWHDAAGLGYLPGTVDYVLHEEQIALTPETENYFYSADSVQAPTYEPGTRPFLEQVLEETTRGCDTDRAKALALVRLIGNPDTNPYREPRYVDMYGPNYYERPLGGDEETVIRKGWHMCNEITRALVFLCQMASIPARTVFLFTDPLTLVGGHAVTEIFFDGKWNLVENNQGVMLRKDDGYFASAVELRDDPSIVNSRPDVGGGLCLCHAAFTGPISVLLYAIDNVDHYSYETQPFK